MIQELLNIYTITELARLIGVNRSTVWRWSNGSKPLPLYKERLEEVYNAVTK